MVNPFDTPRYVNLAQLVIRLYTWGPDVSFAAQYGFKTAAMLWGYDQVDQFQSTVVAGYANAAMGVNE
jgi:hypothetical protein